MRPALRRDDGTTLVEVLSASALMALVLPALLGAMLLVWDAFSAASTSADASSRLSLLSTSFRADVAQATGVVEGGAPCAALAGSSTLVTLSSPVGDVSYVLGTSGGSDALLRLDCTGSSVHESVLHLVPAGGTVALSCSSSVLADPCRTLEMSVPHSGGAHVLTAVRRVS